jgi:hypothetical protein
LAEPPDLRLRFGAYAPDVFIEGAAIASSRWLYRHRRLGAAGARGEPGDHLWFGALGHAG